MIERVKEALVLTYDVLSQPRTALAVITKEQRIEEGLLIWFLTILLSVISIFAQWEQSTVLTFFGVYIGAGLFFLIRLGCLHGTARLLGGKGAVTGIAAGLCFADIPMNLATLAESFVFVVPEEIIHVVTIVAMVWSFVLTLMVVMANYRLGIVRSVLAIILPVVFIAGCIVLFFLYIAMSIVSLVPGLGL